jgi:hypothetical protein
LIALRAVVRLARESAASVVRVAAHLPPSSVIAAKIVRKTRCSAREKVPEYNKSAVISSPPWFDCRHQDNFDNSWIVGPAAWNNSSRSPEPSLFIKSLGIAEAIRERRQLLIGFGKLLHESSLINR